LSVIDPLCDFLCCKAMFECIPANVSRVQLLKYSVMLLF